MPTLQAAQKKINKRKMKKCKHQETKTNKSTPGLHADI